jgi:hypothetical protein
MRLSSSREIAMGRDDAVDARAVQTSVETSQLKNSH